MIDILVPVLGRSQNAQPLVDSIVSATKGTYRIIFICSPEDEEQIQACEATAHDTWIVDWDPGPGDFAKKINAAYILSDSEWVFQGADDIRFSPGWDIEALKVASRGRSVIGTNDLKNPGVKRGQHSTHTLFSRAYIDKYGSGTIDGQGKIFHEGYDHQFTDNEFCQVAMRRGEWAFAKKAVVEHLHPYWGTASWDETYQKAVRNGQADQDLFNQRMS
jgi:glycosyltransferase involved in cell wall biosynthesis